MFGKKFGIFLFFVLLTNLLLSQEISKGVLDLRQKTIDSNFELELKGEWKFYWQKLIDPTKTNEPGYLYFMQPAHWNLLTINGKKLPGSGYASYQIQVLLPKNTHDLAIQTTPINTSYQIFINGELIETTGRVSVNEAEAIPMRKPRVIEFETDTDTLNIVMHISNYADYSGGVWSVLYFGNKTKLTERKAGLLYLDFFLFGAIAIMMLYHLGLFYSRRNEFSTLYFSLFALMVLFRIPVTGETFINIIFPTINYNIVVFLEYFSFFMTPLFFSMFMQSTLPLDFNKKILRGIMAVSSLFVLACIFFSSFVYTSLLLYFQLFTVFVSVYVIFILGKSVINNRVGSKILLSGFLLLFVAIVNDLLFAVQLINSIFLAPFGVFIFIFSQAYMLSIRFSAAFARSETLATELKYVNTNLEHIVNERTAELHQQNEEINAQNENLGKANQLIKAQNSQLEFKNKQVNDSINYAARIQSAMFPSKQLLNSLFAEYFVLWKPRQVVSGDFYWVKVSENRVQIAVGDCTGHGVPGAFVSLLGISFLNEIVKRSSPTNAGQVLEEMRELVKNALNQNKTNADTRDGMDLAYSSIDLQNLQMQYAGANNSLYIIRAGQLIELKPTRNPIGIHRKEQPFEEQNFKLEKNDTIYFFTDGYYDQINDKNVKIKRFLFKQLLLEANLLPIQKQKEFLDEQLLKWQGNKAQVDDILILGIKI